MNYEQFVHEMILCTSKKLSKFEKIEKQEVLKNNGEKLIGLVIRKENEKIVPIIYLEEFYEQYLMGSKIEYLSEQILSQRDRSEFPAHWDYESMLNFEHVQNLIIYRLINFERNRELLKMIPHLEMADFAITFYVMIPTENSDFCSILIRNEHMNRWEVSTSVLYETAKRNTKRLFPKVFSPLMEYMNLPWEFQEGDSPLWILTNEMGLHGASVILYPGMLRMIFERLDSGFYLLPSSIHEFLIVPKHLAVPEAHLREMVQEVNETQLEPEEFLSDMVYHFDGENITKV